jgi:aspartokinase-like uncharacterized kinase
MSEAPVVVKLGGSLFDLPGLGKRLAALLGTLRQREIVLVAGGGAAADVIRTLDRTHQLGEEASHWLALRSLGLTAQVLAAVLPGSAVADRLAECGPLWQAGRTPVLDLFAFARDDEGCAGALPHCWDVTSDSLAARVAEVTGARELILLKSVTVPRELGWTEAGRRGFVDGYFPTVIARGVKARAVNLREWQP